MKPKKSLGQNFLTSGKAIFEIVNAGNIKENDLILEIGPGKGALTEKILESKANLIAIEKDSELIPILEEKFKENIKNKQFTLIKEDILNIDLDKFVEKELKSKKIKNYKLIANIPYYITGAIIEKFLSINKKPEKIVLLVQKEVAERIVCRDKKESILSLAVKFYGNPKLVYKVSAGSFFPKPKVDSTILVIDIEKDQKINQKLEENYFKIIKKAFAHKRKMTISNLKNEISDVNWDKIFEKLNIDKKIRSENISKDIFVEMAKNI